MTTRLGNNVVVSIVVASPFVLLSWWQIWVPYSYWLDELFSVTSSGSLHPDLIGVILNDVHPPLYPLLLKGWIALFGQGETSTRTLSALFSTAAVMVFAWAFRNRSLSFTIPALLFLAASPRTRSRTFDRNFPTCNAGSRVSPGRTALYCSSGR